jgi:hypothetical protein
LIFLENSSTCQRQPCISATVYTINKKKTQRPSACCANDRNTSGSRKNKFAFLSIEAPALQGAKVQEYRDISSFRDAARQDASALKKCEVSFARAFRAEEGKNATIPLPSSDTTFPDSATQIE